MQGKRIEITRRMRSRGIRVGTERQKSHDESGVLNADYWLNTNIQGALAELIVAYQFGVEDRWVERVENSQELKVDVVDHLQVRSTNDPESGLVLHPDDVDGDVFVFVYVDHSLGWANLLGWLWACDGKKEKFCSDEHADHPRFIVPSRFLNPWPAPVWQGEVVRPRPIELQADRKRRRTKCAQRKVSAEFNLVCPRCAWAAKHLIKPYYDSQWSLLGGFCAECCIEAAKVHAKNGWPERLLMENEMTEHEAEDAIKTIFNFPGYKSKRKPLAVVGDDSQTDLGL
jgi:hypothetical protein